MSTAADQTMTAEIPPGYTVHTENTARILLPSETTTFLNPIQEFNRDLSVACIRTWGKRWDDGKRARWENARANGKETRGKKKRKNAGDVQSTHNEKGEDVAMENDPAPTTVPPDPSGGASDTQTNGNENGKEKDKEASDYIPQSVPTNTHS
ncbi:tRNA (guanine-N(2))-methyltransferase [Ceratobasidium sp. AG-Ba]|nr:tRNA (guanine-N(2))-methyltransferase [Ceratobasidium sp. AG-Ba]